MLSVAELLTLPYSGSSASAKGMTAEDFRAQMHEHGKVFRWWKAYDAEQGGAIPGAVHERNGRAYVEQTLPAGAKCFLHSTKFDMMDEQFGLLPAGSTAISVMPDEVELSRLDRLRVPDVLRLQGESLTRTGTNAVLLYPPSQILKVFSGGAEVSPTAYEMTPSGLLWKIGAPAVGASFSIEYRFVPTWEFLFSEQGVIQRGTDGVALPQRGVIRQMRAGETE